jgi:hypothetical protein
VCLPAAAEKNLEALKEVLERLPSSACLCFVGDGPSRADLAKHFEGLPVFFTVRCLLPLMPQQSCPHGQCHQGFTLMWFLFFSFWTLIAEQRSEVLFVGSLSPQC